MTDLDDLIAYVTENGPVNHDKEIAIAKILVSLRDAGKELPGEPEFFPIAHPLRDKPRFACWKEDYDALRAHAVADRANLSIVHGALKASMEAHKKAESRVRALEAEREAMMAKLRADMRKRVELAFNAGASAASGYADPFKDGTIDRELDEYMRGYDKAMTAAIGGDALNELERRKG